MADTGGIKKSFGESAYRVWENQHFYLNKPKRRDSKRVKEVTCTWSDSVVFHFGTRSTPICARRVFFA
jgi:hypothetical protein